METIGPSTLHEKERGDIVAKSFYVANRKRLVAGRVCNLGHLGAKSARILSFLQITGKTSGLDMKNYAPAAKLLLAGCAAITLDGDKTIDESWTAA